MLQIYYKVEDDCSTWICCPFITCNTTSLVVRFESLTGIVVHIVLGNIPSRFSRNSEAVASEFQENIEEVFPGY